MNHLSKRTGNSGTKGDLSLTQVSKKKNIRMSLRDCCCDSLVKNMAIFCSSKENLPEAKLKSYGLTALEEDISKQPTVDCVAWLLVAILYADL